MVLNPGGTLAVQMPVNHMAPSHRFLRDIAQAMFPDRFDFAGYRPPVAAPAARKTEALVRSGSMVVSSAAIGPGATTQVRSSG